jgi:hypothetical protein
VQPVFSEYFSTAPQSGKACTTGVPVSTVKRSFAPKPGKKGGLLQKFQASVQLIFHQGLHLLSLVD